MVSTDQEAAPPKVRPLVANGQHQTNQLPLICCQGLMLRGSRAVEEGDGVLILKENGPKAMCRSVALHEERLLEVGQGQYRCCSNGCLEGDESYGCCLIPGEPLLQ